MACFSQPPAVALSASGSSSSSVSVQSVTTTTTSAPSTASGGPQDSSPSFAKTTIHRHHDPAAATTTVARRISSLSQESSSYNNGRDEVRVCALQPLLRPPSENPWDAVLRVLRQIEGIVEEEGDLDLIVLPELAPLGYSVDTFARFLPLSPSTQVLFQNIDEAFQNLARKLQVYICYGTIGFSSHALQRGNMSIRQVVVDRTGTQVVFYDKMYLCDYGVCAETRFFGRGPASQPVSFSVNSRYGTSFRFGLVICADIRYPGLSRELVAAPEHRVDCILQPAAFARDCSFRTWASFCEARAVENSVYWLGVNYAGEQFGETCVCLPWVDENHEPLKLDCQPNHLIASISRDYLDSVRCKMPFYRTLLLERENADSRVNHTVGESDNLYK